MPNTEKELPDNWLTREFKRARERAKALPVWARPVHVLPDPMSGGSGGDQVNHPDHYTQFPVEVIEITERLNFCMGNVVKYVLRADYKGKPIEDLKKARWYLDREIARRTT